MHLSCQGGRATKALSQANDGDGKFPHPQMSGDAKAALGQLLSIGPLKSLLHNLFSTLLQKRSYLGLYKFIVCARHDQCLIALTADHILLRAHALIKI
jgi:hypothetical protein